MTGRPVYRAMLVAAAGSDSAELAEERGADLVVGANGQGPLADSFLGSVGQYVPRHSLAPVCVVRATHRA